MAACYEAPSKVPCGDFPGHTVIRRRRAARQWTAGPRQRCRAAPLRGACLPPVGSCCCTSAACAALAWQLALRLRHRAALLGGMLGLAPAARSRSGFTLMDRRVQAHGCPCGESRHPYAPGKASGRLPSAEVRPAMHGGLRYPCKALLRRMRVRMLPLCQRSVTARALCPHSPGGLCGLACPLPAVATRAGLAATGTLKRRAG